MRAIISYIEKFLVAGTITTLAAICLVVGLQVIGRYIFQEPPFWTEEVSRFLFIYLIAFGAGLAVRYKGYVNLDVFTHMLPAKVQKILALVVNALLLGFLVVFFMESIDLVSKVQFQRSPVLNLSMSYPYGALLGISGSVILFLLVDSWEVFCSLRKGGDAA